MFNELLQAVEPFLQGLHDISSAGQETLPQVPGNPPVEVTSSSSSVVEGEVSQNEIWAAVDIAEKKQWQDLISSKEWRSTERHSAICEIKISAIVEKTLSLYKEGRLPLHIREDTDIADGIKAYFANLHCFTSNHQRLRHIKTVHGCIGNPRSDIWREIKGYIEY